MSAEETFTNTSQTVIIIGAGPSGLCLANALCDQGLSVMVLERQAASALAQPAFDGREIALTHGSMNFLNQLGITQYIAPEAISSLRTAHILSGKHTQGLHIHAEHTQQAELGYLVSNHLIRQACYRRACEQSLLTIKTEVNIQRIVSHDTHIALHLSNGETLATALLVAADSRFSSTRRSMGIATDWHDFGKTMLVCAMKHEVEHQHIAWEWFDYGQTLALLPMNDHQSSVIVTLPPQEVERLLSLSDEDFSQDIMHRFQQRWGSMQLCSTRHAYPLITSYAKRFIAHRFALVGDAAVGMHPVTAHGFNFGLKGIFTLSQLLAQAVQNHEDIASVSLLQCYERQHRKDTRPLFWATHAISKLYANDSRPAKFARQTLLKLGENFPPFKQVVARFLAK